MACSKCREGSVLPGEPSGTIESGFQGAYYAPKPTDGTSNRAIVFLTDSFGLPLNNCKLMADIFAKRLDCDVWIPDYFAGKPPVPLSHRIIPDRAGVKRSILDWVKMIFFAIPNIPAFISSRPSVADKRAISLITLIKEKKGYERLGIVGYCFGGSAAIRFAGGDYINSVVICHPGFFSMKEVEAIRVPTSWACAEEDIFLSRPLRLKAEATLAARKDKDNFVEYEFKDYKGTAHGFAARPNLDLPEIKEAHERALDQTVEWFEKTLPM